jgi:cytochrome c5
VQKEDKDTMAQVMTVIGVLVMVTVVIFLLARLMSTVNQNTTVGGNEMYEKAADQRLTPIGTVVAGDVNAAPVQRTGKQIVGAVCSSCHGTGALGSPKIGSKSLWAPHVAKGFPTLLNHAENGFKAMPARGGDASLTNDDLKRAIAYMVDQSGFKAPKGWADAGMSKDAKK